jgi:hypothetical protein
MRKTPIMVVVAMLLISTQAFAAKLLTFTLKNGGFETSYSYYIDVYANTEPPGDAQVELGDSFLTITYNDAVLSNPQISDANATLQSSYTLGLDQAGLGAGFTQLQISPAGIPDFPITGSEVWLARISFAIDQDAACSGETAGIAWDGNPLHHQSAGAFLFFSGSDDSALTSAVAIGGTPPVSIAAGNTYSFSPSATGGCGTLTFSIVNPPAWASFDQTTGELRGTPALADVGTTNGVVIGVADQDSGWDELAMFDIEVTATCTAPVISGTPSAFITSGSTYSFIPTVSNGCGVLTFSIVNPPAWASFDPATGELSGTPANADVGVFSQIEITVTDELKAGATLAAFDIQVSDAGSNSSNSNSASSASGGGGGGCFISTLR